MNNIDELFKKQLNKNTSPKPLRNESETKIDFDEILSQIPSDEEYQKQLEEKIKEMSGTTYQREWAYSTPKVDKIEKTTIINPYGNAPKINVSDLISTEEDVRIVIEHVFCPKCGEELVSEAPTMWNPFNLEKMVRTECSKCKFKVITDTAVPTVKFYNKDNKLIKAFHE